MFRARIVVAVPILLTITAACSAQSANSASAACNLEDGRQVYIRYNPISSKNDKLPNGKPWTPGGAPMTLFTEAQLTFAGSMIPVGAYTVYPIPAKFILERPPPSPSSPPGRKTQNTSAQRGLMWGQPPSRACPERSRRVHSSASSMHSCPAHSRAREHP